MSLARFITYVSFSRTCPDYVHASRWVGMLKWYDTRIALDDSWICGKIGSLAQTKKFGLCRLMLTLPIIVL